MEFNIGFPRKIANFEVHFVWSGKKKRVEKEKNNPKGFCPISLNNTHVAYKGPNWKKPNWSNNRQKFHRSKNSLIQLFFQDTLLSKVSLFPVISQHLQHIYSTCRPAIKLSIFYLLNYFFFLSGMIGWNEHLCSTWSYKINLKCQPLITNWILEKKLVNFEFC